MRPPHPQLPTTTVPMSAARAIANPGSLAQRQARRGSPYIVVLIFAFVLLIFLVTLTRVKTNQILLLSRTAQDFLALTVAETGLNCALGEMSVDYDFSTHNTYSANKPQPWGRATKRKHSPFIADFKDISISSGNEGTYAGTTGLGGFKVRVAKQWGKSFALTQTLAEEHMFTHAMAMGHVGEAYRKIDALLEKRCIFSEHLLYDGEILDLALGPFENAPYKIDRGRLYGYQYVTFSTLGGTDQGCQPTNVEKIESPGMIRAFRTVQLAFADGSTAPFTPDNDSSNPGKFNTHAGRLVDGNHSAHTHKIHRLSKEYYQVLTKNQDGVVLTKKDFAKPSLWRNPYKPKEEYYDLDFGEFASNDDPFKTGDKENAVIYSEVPLRIFGGPDGEGNKTITIFCEKDIVIGGDFNQRIDCKQDYPDKESIEYATKINNGTKRGDKVGALLLSLGRVWIDHSRPARYLKNELRPYFMLLLARALRPTFEDEKFTRGILCPADPAKRDTLPGRDKNGHEFGTIVFFFENRTPNPVLAAEKISDVTDLLTPGPVGKPRFAIKDEAVRKKIIDEVIRACRDPIGTGPCLSKKDQDTIFEMVWAQAVKEEEEDTKSPSAPMALVPYLYDEAMKDFTDSIYPPEITINAILVSSARRFAKFTVGVGMPKVLDEIGNIDAPSAGLHLVTPAPAVLIQRLYGSEIRLANMPADVFLDGQFSGTRILRRRSWDKGNQSGAFQPVGLAYTYNILTFWEGLGDKGSFDQF